MRRKNNVAALRWQAAVLVGRTGKIPLLLGCLPCGLLAFWLSSMAPQSDVQREHLETLEARLALPLPKIEGQPEPHSSLSQSEYQMAGLVFDKLQQSGLQVEASRYQRENGREGAALRLDIPLKGEYLPLVEALESLSRTLPLQIGQITLRRSALVETQLDVTLQLYLHKELP
ncbi:hypothetical protein ACLBW2_16905 [Enterobacteriaceae bacterium C23F]